VQVTEFGQLVIVIIVVLVSVELGKAVDVDEIVVELPDSDPVEDPDEVELEDPEGELEDPVEVGDELGEPDVLMVVELV
jgi:hypothetical protein